MVVLNFYGIIPIICISDKLKLYLSNLPNEEHNKWRDELSSQLCLAQKADDIYQHKLGTNYSCGIEKLYKIMFPQNNIPATFKKKHFDEIADNMICLAFDYRYEDMPLGGWDTNCFDGRLCEEDYAEKIINFINFLAYHCEESPNSFPEPTAQWVYSSNHDEIDYYRIFWGGQPAPDYISSLKKWGILFDTFLQCKNDYLLFDYLVNSIYKDNEYNEYHLIKAFSLCQLFLEKEHESELDEKLILFLDEEIGSKDDRKKYASLLRKLRNKIAHGDFIAFEKYIEEYATSFMDKKFAFDYSEYSRKKWAIQYICCQLDDIVRKLIYMLFYDRTTLEQLKKNR